MTRPERDLFPCGIDIPERAAPPRRAEPAAGRAAQPEVDGPSRTVETASAEPASQSSPKAREPQGPEPTVTPARRRSKRLWTLGAVAASGAAPAGVFLLSQRPAVAAAAGAVATLYIAALTTYRDIRNARDNHEITDR
ncbi:hypothetical protein [Actinomadura macra]|uniref:hypothetical protein n=1 Tax=Actinomadura macra TaxID=46164 RepID=UPI00082D427F|nr:hypothetical protein [Actinomadura macra]